MPIMYHKLALRRRCAQRDSKEQARLDTAAASA
jgi:hypothetical protein